MAAESTATTAQAASVPTVASNQTWLQKHERLIIWILCIVLGYFVVDKGLSIVSSYEQHKAQQANTVLNTQKTTTDTDLEQAKAQLVVYENALAEATKENATLAAAIASRNQIETAQQKTDATLQPSQLATRWQGLVNNTGIRASASGYAVTDTAAIDTVQQLEQIPVLTQNVADEAKEISGLQTAVDSTNTLVLDGKNTITSLQSEVQDESKACSTQVTALQSQITKAKFASIWEKAKWFGAGFVTGFVTGVLK